MKAKDTINERLQEFAKETLFAKNKAAKVLPILEKNKKNFKDLDNQSSNEEKSIVATDDNITRTDIKAPKRRSREQRNIDKKINDNIIENPVAIEEETKKLYDIDAKQNSDDDNKFVDINQPSYTKNNKFNKVFDYNNAKNRKIDKAVNNAVNEYFNNANPKPSFVWQKDLDDKFKDSNKQKNLELKKEIAKEFLTDKINSNKSYLEFTLFKN